MISRWLIYNVFFIYNPNSLMFNSKTYVLNDFYLFIFCFDTTLLLILSILDFWSYYYFVDANNILFYIISSANNNDTNNNDNINKINQLKTQMEDVFYNTTWDKDNMMYKCIKKDLMETKI